MKIGLVPISAKPYHAGHHSLVTTASSENDKVILFVSTSDRMRKDEFPIRGADMVRVWAAYLEPMMPGNVEVRYGGSPVQKVYQTLQDACESGTDDIFVVYSDPADTAQNYPESNRRKYFPSACDLGQVVFAAERSPGMFTRGVGTPDVSGTKMRQALADGDVDTFAAGMPEGVDSLGIFDMLGGNVRSEAVLRACIGEFLRG